MESMINEKQYVMIFVIGKSYVEPLLVPAKTAAAASKPHSGDAVLLGFKRFTWIA